MNTAATIEPFIAAMRERGKADGRQMKTRAARFGAPSSLSPSASEHGQ